MNDDVLPPYIRGSRDVHVSPTLRALLPEHPAYGAEYQFTSEHATPGALNQLLYAIQDEYTRLDWSEVAGDFYQDLVDLFHLSTAYSIPCAAQSVINFIRKEIASSDVKSFADSAYLFIVACQCDQAELAAEIVRQDRLPANSRQGAKYGYWKGINYTWGHVRGQGGLYYDNFTPEMMQMLTQPYRLGLHLSSQVEDMDEAARVFLSAARG